MRVLLFLLLVLPALAATPEEVAENRQWTQEIRAYAAAHPAEKAILEALLDDAGLLAELDEHKAHDALAALRAKIQRGEKVTSPVGNYGEVVPGKLYRGAQPSPAALRWLAGRGVKTIVLLREPGVEETNYPGWSRADYIAASRALGMEVLELSIRDRTLPTPEQVKRFLEAADRSTCFVHCSAGIGRTGIMSGLYLRHLGQSPESALEQNKRYLAQPDVYPDHALQAAFMQNYPLDGAIPPAPSPTGPPNPVLAGLKSGVRLDLQGARPGAIPAVELAPELIVREGETYLVSRQPSAGQNPLELHPMGLLVDALKGKRLVRLEFNRANLDLLGALSRALPAAQKMGYIDADHLLPAEVERVRAWLGPGVPLQARGGGALGVKPDVVGPQWGPTSPEQLVRLGVAREVESSQGLSGWYLEVLR